MAIETLNRPPPPPRLQRDSLRSVGGLPSHSSQGAKTRADEIRTRDPLLAKQVLYQLSYDPIQGQYIVIV